MQKDIILSWHFPHPVEKVWDCLTDAALVSEWLMKTDFKPVVGHRFNFYSRPLPAFGWDGIVHCEVLTIEPHKRISFSWKGGSNGKINLDTVVTWTLTAMPSGTQLKLEHTGFKRFKNFIAAVMMEKGWQKIMKRRFTAILNAHPNAANHGSVSGTR